MRIAAESKNLPTANASMMFQCTALNGAGQTIKGNLLPWVFTISRFEFVENNKKTENFTLNPIVLTIFKSDCKMPENASEVGQKILLVCPDGGK